MASIKFNKKAIVFTVTVLVLCICILIGYFTMYVPVNKRVDTLSKTFNEDKIKKSDIPQDTRKSEFVGEEINQGTFILKDLSVYDTVNKKFISIGMTKEQIEESLGMEGVTVGNQKAAYYYKGLKVLYRDNKAVGLIITYYDSIEELSKRTKNGEKAEINNGRYVTSRNIGLGYEKNDVLNKYGESGNGTGSNVLVYFLQKKGDSIEILPPIGEGTQPKDKNDQYYLSFNFTKDNQEKAEFIQVGDYEFTFFQR